MAQLVLVAYPPDDPLGTPLGVLSDAAHRAVTVDDEGTGSGSFTIHPASPQAAWCTPGTYVLAYRDVVTSPADAVAGFWLEEAAEVLRSPDEDGGRAVEWSGRGSIAYLADAVVWHRAVSGRGKTVHREEGEWRWRDAHPARVLVRLLEEAQARGALAALSWDFTRTTDSDGVPFATSNAEKYVVPIGTDLLTVVDELRATGLAVTCTPELVLRAWDASGRDLSATIDFAAGIDIRDTVEREIAARRARSHLLMEGENRRSDLRYRPVRDAAIEAALGRRREGFFRFTRTATKAVLTRVGERKLRRWALARDGPTTLPVLDTPGQVALVDYTVGDTVSVHLPPVLDHAPVRIASISLVETEAGELDPVLELRDTGTDVVTGEPLRHEPGEGSRGGGGDVADRPAPCSRCRFPPIPTRSYPLDRFDRVVPPPTTVDGDAVAGLTSAGAVTLRRSHDAVPVTTGPVWVPGSTPRAVESYLGSWYSGWTGRPSWTGCGGLDNSFQGYRQTERWWKLTVPVHPADMAGIRLTVAAGAAGGVQGPGYGEVMPIEVVVRSEAPTTLRQGLVVGEVMAGRSAQVVIPADAVPSAGGTLYIGYRTGWESPARFEEYAYACGWSWPSMSEAHELDHRGRPYLGYSGGIDVVAPSGAIWQVLSGGSSGIGTTADPVATDAPWDGPHTWTDAGAEGSDLVTQLDGQGLLFTATAPSGRGFALTGPGEDEDAGHGPWSDVRGSRHDVEFSLDAIGLTGEAGTRSLELATSGQGSRAVATVHLGDGTHAPGVSVAGPVETVYLEKPIAADTPYVLAFDTRAGVARAKLWPAATPEPAGWDVEAPLAATSDSADRLTLFARVGNVTGAQTLRIRRITAARAAVPGQVIAGELVGLADGESVRFPTAHPYEPGSLRASVNGADVVPVTESPQHAAFELDARPTAGSWLRVRYLAADKEAA